MAKDIKLSIVLLNWNRLELLRGCLLSLQANTSASFEIIVVDNNSNDGSERWIQRMGDTYANVTPILLDQNLGGVALNPAIEKCKGEFIMISENDLEFLPNWDEHMITAFSAHPNLGLLSPFSPFPEKDFGENWMRKEAVKIDVNGVTIYKTETNVGTSCMFRADVRAKNKIIWENLAGKTKNFVFPNDGEFSRNFRLAGYDVCWSDRYLAINWGHNDLVTRKNPDYYRENWRLKTELKIDGLDPVDTPEGSHEHQRLVDHINEITQKMESLKREKDPLSLLKLSEPGRPHFQLYLDYGDGFVEDQTLRKPANIGQNTFKFKLDEPKPLEQLRIDPLNLPCIVENITLLINGKTLHRGFETNAAIVKSEKYFFATLDPQFIFDISDFKEIHSIEISLNIPEIGVQASLTTAVELELKLKSIQETNSPFLQLFLSTSKNFRNDPELRRPVKGGKNEFTFDFKKPTSARHLRIDPFNQPAIVNLKSIKVNGLSINIEKYSFETNSLFTRGSLFFFTHETPYILLDLGEKKSISSVEITIRVLSYGNSSLIEIARSLFTETSNSSRGNL